MAKRHHASKSMKGEKGYYDGIENRRSLETQDSYMIREDHSKIANLPQEVMIKDWPRGYSYMGEPLDDSISGIDRQLSKDDGMRNKLMNPHKY
jgi:hypothetical protein